MSSQEQRYPPSEEPALKAVRGYFEATNAHDGEAFQDTLNYPHTRLAAGGIRHWEQRPAPSPNFLAEVSKNTPDWHHSTLDEAKVVQSSRDKVHVALRFTRWDASGKALETHHSFYVVTNQDGHWGIQVRSSFLPYRQL